MGFQNIIEDVNSFFHLNTFWKLVWFFVLHLLHSSYKTRYPPCAQNRFVTSRYLISGDYSLCSCRFSWKLAHISPNPGLLGCLPGTPPLFPVSGDDLVRLSTLCKCLDFGKQFAFRKSTLWCPSTSTHLLFTTAYPPWVVKRWSLSQMTLDERRRCSPDKSPEFRKWAAIKFYVKSTIYLQMPAISTEAFWKSSLWSRTNDDYLWWISANDSRSVAVFFPLSDSVAISLWPVLLLLRRGVTKTLRYVNKKSAVPCSCYWKWIILSAHDQITAHLDAAQQPHKSGIEPFKCLFPSAWISGRSPADW